MRAPTLKQFDDVEQVADRARQPIEPDHDQDFARTELTQQTSQRAWRMGRCRRRFLEDCRAAGGAQLIALRIGALFVRGDPRVADQTVDGGAFPGWWLGHAGCSLRGDSLYNSTMCLQMAVCRGGRGYRACSGAATVPLRSQLAGSH